MTMTHDEAKEYIEESLWGENSDDTKVLARMLLEIAEQQRIGNLLKVLELGLLSGEELEALKDKIKESVGLPAHKPTVN